MTAGQDIYTALERSGRLDTWLATGNPAWMRKWQMVADGANDGGWRIDIEVRLPAPYTPPRWKP